MRGSYKELALLPISKKFIREGGYRARMASRDVLSYDEVLEEVIQRNFLRMDPHALKMILEETFETMIEGTLRDGKTRRLGDYFMLQMEVRGKFDGPGEQFDEQKHKLALKLRPLKAFRRTPGRDGVSVYNRNAGPKVVIDGVLSAGASESGVVCFGEDIIVTGENLGMICRAGDVVKDKLDIKYFGASKSGSASADPDEVSVNEAGTRMVIPWKTVGDLISINGDAFGPEQNRPVGLMVGLRSRGGCEESKMQLHRGKAYFDTWLAHYPHRRGDFSRMVWGAI